MPTRNTPVLEIIVKALGDLVVSEQGALARLHEQFKDDLLIVAGDVTQIERFADQLRLRITTPEASQALDYIQTTNAAGINIDITEEAINALFGNRFIEPEQ